MSYPKLLDYILILIVAPPTSYRDILFDYLQGYGYRVLGAHNGESALRILEYLLPDIILLDADLPNLDGFETCRRLKNRDLTRHIPVIFLTAQSDISHKMRGFSLGAVDYLTKPIQSEEVLIRLRNHLALQSLQQHLEDTNIRLKAEIAEREVLIEELDAFSHTVAHDLKNPVGVMISYAQFLQKYISKMSPEELQQYANNILRNGYKMNNIIDDLLLLASVRTEDITLAPVDIGQTMAEAETRLNRLVEEYRASINTPTDWPVVLGYAPWIEAVWTNYLSNAIKYGGEPPHIETGALPCPNGMVKFWVKDNGRGVLPQEQKHLFSPFTRFSQINIEGHGLGLSIVHRIVEKLGGAVEVESDGIPGHGSIFSFYLRQAVGPLPANENSA